MTSEEKRNLDLVVRLAVIVGHCNVLYEMMEEGSQQASRLALIRGMAASAMKELTEHQQKNGSTEAKSESRKPRPPRPTSITAKRQIANTSHATPNASGRLPG